MLISGGMVFDSKGSFTKNNVYISGERISWVLDKSCSDSDIIDASGMYVIPGLIDIHFHGCAGHDFCEGTTESLERILKHELSCGITSVCPASMTLPEEKLSEIFSNAASYDNKDGSTILGINMEGPFLSAYRAGAQNTEYIVSPDVEMYRRLSQKAKGLIRIVNIAPEVEGAYDFIEALSDSVIISVAHTNADYDTSKKAFEMGVNHVTHLFNAMPPFHHRRPGVIGAAYDCNHVYVELIADSVHCDPAVVRAAVSLFNDRVVFISDSMEACGMGDGEYSLGGQKVSVNNKLATLSDGTIAGSVSNLMDCVINSVLNIHIALEQAVKCATVNAAKSINVFADYGSIEVGKIADILVLDKNLKLVHIIKHGRKIIT